MATGFFTPSWKRVALLLAIVLYGAGTQDLNAQFTGCTGGTPTFTFNFVGNPAGSFVSSNVSRSGDCCSDNNCVRFILILDTLTAAVNFEIASGAIPPGSLAYEIDCSGQQTVGQAICISNTTGAIDTFNLTFCKPGNNANTYRVTAIPEPFFPDYSVAIGCFDTLKTFGLAGTISWQSVSPGTLGQYNNLLSCTNCTSPTFIPNATTPSLVRYRVCGGAQASACVGNLTFCDTVDVTVLPLWSSVADQTVCAPATTTNLGSAPVGSSWSVISGNPAAASINASTGVVTGMTANGTYRFLLMTTSGKCRDTVQVIRATKPNAGADQTICRPQSTTSLGAAPGGQTWSAMAGNPAAATVNPSTGAVTGMTVVGTYNFILGTGSCSDTVAVVVKAQPATPTAGSNSPLCVGATLNLTASTVPTATYSWVGPSSFASTSQNPSINNVNTSNAGTYKVVAIIDGCSSDTGSTVVVINTIPPTPSPSSNSPVCETDTIKLFANVSGGTFSWTGPGGFSSSAQDTIRLNATIAMSGSYCLIRTVSNCPSPQSCTSVSVNTKPVISGVSGTSPTTCGGSTGSITINGLTAGQSYSVNYDKDGIPQGPVVLIANGSGQIIISGLSQGAYTAFSVTLGSCTSNTFVTTINLSNPATPSAPGVSSNSPVCETDTIKLFATGEVGASFSWTGPSGFNNSTQNPIRTNATLAMGGSYCATQTVAGCTSPQGCVSINVNPKPAPAGTSSSNPTTCLGTNGSITINGLTAGQTYTVNYSRNTVAQSPLNILANGSGQVIITGLNAGSYSDITLTLTGCVSNPILGPIVLTDPTTPAAPSVGSNSPVCEGDSIKLTASGVGGAVYDWDGPSGFNTATQNPGVANATQVNAGSYCVTQTVAACTGPQACVSVTVKTKPVITGGVGSNPTSCGGSNGSITLNGFTPGSSYSVSYSYNSNPQTPVVLVADLSGNLVLIGLAQGNYSLFTVTLDGCVSLPLGGTITLSDPSTPNPPSLGSNSPVCVGRAINLTASGAGGASYNWTGPDNYASTSQNPTINNATLVMGGNYCATQTVSGCTSAPACVNVIVSPNPVVNAGVDTTVCNGKPVRLGGSPTASSGFPDYNYTWSGGAASVSNPVVSPSSTTIYTLTVTDDRTCSATGSVTVNVNSNPTANAGPDRNLVACDAVGISIGGSPTASGGASPYQYVWAPGSGLSSTTVSNPTVSGLGSNTIYNVTVTDDNGCSSTDGMEVTVVGSAVTTGISPNGSLEWCEGSNGSVLLTATPSGGVGPYLYSWSGTSITPTDEISATASPNTAGTYQYNLVVTDNVGCQAGATISVTVNPKPVADAGPNRTICNGNSVQIGGSPTGSGGTGTLSYSWNNGASPIANPTVSPSSALSYVVTVTDSKNCSSTASMLVNVNANPIANAGTNKVLPSCSPTGLSIGGTPTASGGLGPNYTYDWSPSIGLNSTAVANPTVSGILTDETYTVTVTDQNNCSSSAQVFVDVINNSPSVNITGASEWCAGSGGNTVLNANISGGTSAFTYSWSGTNISPTDAPAATVNPAVAGTYNYNITITDAFNCTASATTSVTVNPNPVANAGPDETICSGANVEIGGSPTGSGGTGGLSYSWSGGAAPVANPTVSPLSQTTYIVTVTDFKNCSATSSATVFMNPNPTADAGADKILPSCSPTGISIGGVPTASGGGGAPFSYAWSPAAGLNDSTLANPTVAGILSTQTYTVVVTDANGCRASNSMEVTVTNNTPSVSIITIGSSEWCTGSGSSASLNANVSGGTPTYTYIWSGTNINPTNAQVANVNPNTPGSYDYQVTVTDAFNCTSTANTSITVNPNPIASAGLDTAICGGGSVRIGGTPTGSGGTPGYNYIWSGGAAPIMNPIVSPPTTTTYQVTVTDSKNCSATSAVTVSVSFTPVANAGVDKTLVGCPGISVSIGGTPTASGGVGNYTYVWSPSTGLDDATIANPSVSGIVSSQIYCVTVTDQAGCSSTDCMQVTVTPSTLQAQVANNTSICSNAAIGVSLGGAPTVLGGTPPFTYAWSPDAGLDNTASSNPTALPSITTNYCLTVSDANGCTSTACVSVTVRPAPVVNAGIDTSLCSGTCISIGGSPSASGGTGNFNYSWTPGNGLSGVGISSPQACPLSTTTYTLVVTDLNGCSASDNISVIVHPSVVADAGLDRIHVNCPGSELFLGGTPSAKFGTGPFIYSWSPSTALSATNVPNPTLTGLGTGTLYTLSVTDANGCTSTDQTFVFVEQSTLQAEAGTGGVICAGSGDSILLGGFPTAVGGYSRYTYNWSPTSGLTLSNPANPYAKPSVTTTYYVTVTDDVGCEAIDSVTVFVNQPPFANAGRDTSLCSGFCAVIGGGPTASGGTPGYQYMWSPTQGLSAVNIANPTACPAISTTYLVTVTDSRGCTATDLVVVTVNQNPIANAGPDKSIFVCPGDSVQIGGTPSGSGGTGLLNCTWTPSTGLNSTGVCNPYVKGITNPVLYILTVSDMNGCISTDEVLVTISPNTLAAEAGNDVAFCIGSSNGVNIGGTPTALGGTAPYQYNWAPNGGTLNLANPSNPVALPNTTTTYYVTVTDGKGCTAIDSVKVIANQPPVADAGVDKEVCAGFCTSIGALNVATGGTPPYQYTWGPSVGLNAVNVSNPNACPSSSLIYQVTVTDANGCQSVDAMNLTVNPNPVANAGSDKTFTQCPGDSIQIGGTPSGTGGTGTLTCTWSPSTGLSSTNICNPNVKGISGTIFYTLTITDSKGCQNTDVVQVTSVPSNLTAEAGQDGNICAGSVTGYALGGVPTAVGGTPGYSYSWTPTGSLDLANPANPVARPLSNTRYYVTVTDSKGCSAVDSVNVVVNPLPTVNAGIDTAICQGASVTLGTGTGNPGNTYTWSPGIGLSSTSAANPTATPLSSTTYTLTVVNSNGCSATDNILVTVRNNPFANAGPDKSIVACSADSVMIGGSPSGGGGSGTLTCNWSPSGGLNNAASCNPYVKNIGSPSIYTLVVSDQFGCSATDQVLVNVTNSNMVATAGNSVSFCEGSSVSVALGGSPTVVGGTPSYTYTWTPAIGLSDPSAANPIASPTVSTTYRLAVSDASGCVATDSVRITIHPRPVVNAGSTDTLCSGSCKVLGGVPTASGGTGSNYTYSWIPTNFLSASNVPNPSACPTANVTYTLTVFDSLNCSNSANITIIVNQNPVANAGQDRTTVPCPRACINIGGSPTATNGTAPFIYNWSPQTGLSSTSASNPLICNLSSGNTYSVTVTDANGCTSKDDVVVTLVPSTLTADAGPDRNVCIGQNTGVLIGGAPTASGGQPPYAIDWSPSTGILNSTTISNPLANPLTTTVYTVLVQDAFGCEAADSMVVIANPSVTASVGLDTSVCQGGSALLGGNPTASGGTPGFTFNWSPGTGLTNTTASNPIATPLVTTTYCVTVTDLATCSASACQTVNVNQSINANAGIDQSMINCPGSFVILGSSPTASGGSGNYSYIWSPATNLNGSTIPNPVVTGLTVTTSFTVTVTDNATGCIAIDEVTVNVNPSTLAADAGSDKVRCANNTSCINIGGNFTAQGGQFPYSYQWAPVTGLNNPNIANPCASPGSTTTYNVTVTDALGCNVSASMNMFVSPIITVDAGNDTITCLRTSVSLGGNPIASGGTGNYTYAWSPSLFLVPNSNVARPTAQNITSNVTYTLTVTDSIGCTATDNISISTRALPSAFAGPDATIFACTWDSAIIGGAPTASGTVGPYTYEWSPPFDISLSCNNCPNPIVKNLGFQTNFCVVVTDSFGCKSDPDCAVVTVLPNTVVVDAGFNLPSLCSNNLSCVTLGGPVPVSGGVGPYTYQWLGGVSNPTIPRPQACPATTTTYRLIGTDSKGCQSTDTVRIIVNDPPIASMTGLNSKYCISDGDVTITGIPSGGSFTSIPGLFGNIFRPSVAGVGNWCIKYTYTDPATGCSDDTTICVTVNPLPVVSVTGFNPSYCLYEPEVNLIGNPSGGTFSGKGVNSTGTFNPSLAGLGLDTITYTYTNSQTGCTNSTQIIINVKNAPTLSLTASKQSVCNGSTVIITPLYSLDVSNIVWTQLGGGNIGGGTGPITITPTGPQYCVVATAINSPNQCLTRDTICVDVNVLPTVSVVGFPATYCLNQPPVPLVGSPSGGTFTGTGVFNGAFNPAITGIGNWCIRYTYTDPITGCTGDTTLCVAVNAPPVVSISGNQSGYCRYDTIQTFIGNPVGGTFSGPGISSNGAFNPATANIGNNTITYTYTDQLTGCSNTATITVEVKPAPTLNLVTSVDSVCGGTPVNITANYSLDVTNIFWYNSNGNLIATSTNPLVVQPAGVDFCVSARVISTNQCLTRDTICVHVTQAPRAQDDTASTCEEQLVSVNVLANDSNFEGTIATIVILRQGNGSATVSGTSVNYRPNTNFNGRDTVTYRVCTKNCNNACDTANVYIDICPINDPPTAVTDNLILCGDSVRINVLLNDSDIDGDSIYTVSIPCAPRFGTASLNTDGSITYTKDKGLTTQNPDTFCYSICDNGSPVLCDTATIIISLCRIIDARPDTVLICRDQEVNIRVLDNDTVSNGNKLTITNATLPIPGTLGGISFIGTDVISFMPNGNVGTVRFQYYVCDDGSPVLCDTGSIVINIRDCPLPVVDTIYDTTYVNTPDTVCIDQFVFSLPDWTIQSICEPQNGTVTIIDSSCFIYIPQDDFFGDDTFCIIICNEFGCDTSAVVMTVLDTTLLAIPEPCDVDTTSGTKPITVNVLANDIVPLAGDTVVTIIITPANGTAEVNDDHTITYTPNNEFKGDEHFTYMVCAITGSYIYCDTADVCITVLGPCFIPNAFSPNGDGVNDIFQIPCNDDYPEATLKIYNRWGIEVWNSEGPYRNNFAGYNMQGIRLPDGTYYLVYDYNDGSGKREAKYVVIHR